MRSELVVFSHLRWTFVWQRPQQLISRLAADRRVFFVEELRPCDVAAPVLRHEERGPVTRVWLDVPGAHERLGFEAAEAGDYGPHLADFIAGFGGVAADRVAWLYTPLALDLALAVDPAVLVYDVMDDLASFQDAAPQLTLRHRQALVGADVVFTGGRSLHRAVTRRRAGGVHLFPSGVDVRHYAAARSRRRKRSRPVAGYVGVVDERLDRTLIADLAAALPDWDVCMVGPVAKVDAVTLPQAPNLIWAGPRPYSDLPAVMAGFDVALMPFALNAATRSISPTKTLEYLAAGLPVVSTRVPDVVADFGHVVALCDDGQSFADACVRLRDEGTPTSEAVVEPLLRERSWDAIAERMGLLVQAAQAAAPLEEMA